MTRYGRQITVRGVGQEGHQAIRSAHIRLAGEGIAAEVCASYLAGAGVGRLEVSEHLLVSCRSVNSEIEVERFDGETTSEQVWLQVVSIPDQPVHTSFEEGVGSGARAARWALARILQHP